MNYSYPYQNYMPPQPMAAPQSQSSGILWVQGETGAKSYLVAPGQSVLLMDSEDSRFFIKSSDPSGMPMPLRVFEYKELSEQTKAPTEYVTRKEFDELIQRLKKEQNNESSV